MDACRIARIRDATGGGVLPARMAFSAALFQVVTTSAWATAAMFRTAPRISNWTRWRLGMAGSGLQKLDHCVRAAREFGEPQRRRDADWGPMSSVAVTAVGAISLGHQEFPGVYSLSLLRRMVHCAYHGFCWRWYGVR